MLCVTLALLSGYDAQAQSKKKGKEPELAISKRGNLIFEDDFSGKELEWVVLSGEWKVLKKALATNSVKKEKTHAALRRNFLPVSDVIFELKVYAPTKCGFTIGHGVDGVVSGYVEPRDQQFSLTDFAKEGAGMVATGNLQYPKPRWMSIAFELVGNKCAFTVDGKTIQHESIVPERKQPAYINIMLSQYQPDLFAIDDVKVWEALPKDEEPEKDKKKK